MSLLHNHRLFASRLEPQANFPLVDNERQLSLLLLESSPEAETEEGKAKQGEADTPRLNNSSVMNFLHAQSVTLDQSHRYDTLEEQEAFIKALLSSSARQLVVQYEPPFFPLYRVLREGTLSQSLKELMISITWNTGNLALFSKALRLRASPLTSLTISHSAADADTHGLLYLSIQHVEKLIFNHKLMALDAFCLQKAEQRSELSFIKCFPDVNNSFTPLLWKLVVYSAMKFDLELITYWFGTLFRTPEEKEEMKYMASLLGHKLTTTGSVSWM